jgi:hypothetical protein
MGRALQHIYINRESSHVVRQLLEVGLLLVQLLLELEEPLLLALANGVVLVGALAALEGISVSWRCPVSMASFSLDPESCY